jgi:hypothetical protein
VYQKYEDLKMEIAPATPAEGAYYHLERSLEFSSGTIAPLDPQKALQSIVWAMHLIDPGRERSTDVYHLLRAQEEGD